MTTEATYLDQSSKSQIGASKKAWVWTGRVLSGITILFMLFDAAGKLFLESHVIEATTKIGYPMAAIRPLGVIALICTILYAVPRTAILGAVLLTAFYGGAVASKIRIEDPLFSSILFSVYLGLITWGGLYLRDERLRSFFPWRR
jgi:DoxX-like family